MKKNLLKFTFVLVLMILVPVLVSAQTPSPITYNPCDAVEGLAGIICRIQRILNATIPLLMTLGVVYFVYGVVTYVIADGEEAKTKGRDQIISGIIGMAVILGLWGLVAIVSRTFQLDRNSEAPSSETLKGLLPHNR